MGTTRRSGGRGAPNLPSSGSGGYNPATSAGRSTTSAGYGPQNRTYRDEYWGDPNYAVSRPTTTPSGRTLNSGYYQGTSEGYQGYAAARRQGMPMGGYPTMPSLGGGGGGGGGRRGGGGGGGGGPAMTQAMLDQMLKALGTMGPALKLNTVDLPDFRGQNLPAFNPAVYNQATNELTGAFNADVTQANQAMTNAATALQANYTNPYATAQVTQAPAQQPVGSALQATTGGGGAQQTATAAEGNQAAASDQQSFANLLNILGAADQAAQASRMNQVELDRVTAQNNIGAQRRGILGGINMARTQAANEWAQRDAERRYQNSLMGQQWNREEMMRNQDITNQQAQGNWQQRQQMIAQNLAPLLDMITRATGLNLGGVQNLLGQWNAPVR